MELLHKAYHHKEQIKIEFLWGHFYCNFDRTFFKLTEWGCLALLLPVTLLGKIIRDIHDILFTKCKYFMVQDFISHLNC